MKKLHLSFVLGLTLLLLMVISLPVRAASEIWSGASGTQDWYTSGNWNSGSGPAPGAIVGTTNGDTATFNTATAGTSVTIDSGLNIQSITFDSSNVGTYTIGSAGANAGDALHLSSGGTISLTATAIASTETIDAPLVLEGATTSTAGTYTFTNESTSTGLLNVVGNISIGTSSNVALTLSGSNTGTNTISGVISNGAGIGALSVTKSGAGTWVLTEANAYRGGTTVSAGTLMMTNGVSGSATGSGALSVGSSGTIGGIGTSASGSHGFNIAGNVIAGSGLASDTTGVTMITGAAVLNNSTLANATLAFNLNSASLTSTSIDVGSTGVTFGSTAFHLSLQGTSIVPTNTPFVLVAGLNTGDLAGVDGSQYTGITTAASGADGLLAGQYKILSGVSLSFTDSTIGQSYAPSFLFLNTVGGVDNIEVEVVPEPGTWALMLGGLALLVFIPRRKRE